MCVLKRLSQILISAVVALSLAQAAFAAPKKPYPQYFKKSGVPYPSMGEVECSLASKYVRWVNTYIKPYNQISGALMVEGHITGELEWEGVKGLSASEHTGYGMIISALMDGYQRLDNPICQVGSLPVNYQPKEIFDGLFKLYKGLPSSEGGSHLMSWVVPDKLMDGGNKRLSSSASDGDMDIAYGLILAHKQWGDKSYKDAAVAMLKDIRDYDISSEGLILSGNWAHGDGTYENVTRSSDWMLDHLAAFDEYLADDIWADVRTRTKAALTKISHSTTGLMPDFVNYDGSTARALGPVFQCEPFPTQYFSENASRTPWRLAQYYLHTNDSAAKDQLKKLAAWAKSKAKNGSNYDWSRIKDTYKLDGSDFSWSSLPTRDDELGQNCTYSASDKAEGLSKGKNKNRLNFTAPLIASLVADGTGSTNRKAFTQGWSYLMSAKDSSDDDYFGDSVRLLTMLTLTRAWWDPVKAYSDDRIYNVNTGAVYTDLQTAVDAAKANQRLIVGADANIYPGANGLMINVDGLILEGAVGPHGRATLLGNTAGTAITVNAGVDNVVITGFDVVSFDYGVVNWGKHTVISNMTFQTDNYGVRHRGEGGEVSHSQFVLNSWAAGVEVWSNSSTPLLVTRNIFRGGNYGVNSSGRVWVYNNTFYGGSYPLAIYSGSKYSRFRNNLITNAYQAIYVSGSVGSMTFTANLLYRNNVNTMPAGYSDSRLVVDDPGLTEDLVPTTAAAIDRGIYLTEYTSSVPDNRPDIGAIEVLQ